MKKFAITGAAVISLLGLVAFASVQAPRGASAAVPDGRPSPETSASPEGAIPGEGELMKFREESGFEPEAYAEAEEPEPPKFEEPGKVPAEVRQYVSDKDLAGVYCATARWKSGGFLTAMDAVKKFVIPAAEKAKGLGFEVDLPDVDALKAEGLKRIEAVCSAPSADEAERLVQDFSAWGRKEAASKLDGLRSSLEGKMKAKGDELRRKVKTQVDAFVQQERQKLEQELRQEAEQSAAAKQAELEAAQDPDIDVEAVRAQLQSKIESKAKAKSEEMRRKAQEMAKEIVGGDGDALEEIGGLFNGIGKKINDEIKAGESQYLQYKEQAFGLRKSLVLKVLDGNLEEGLKQLDDARQSIEDAKKEDPSIKGVGEVKAELQQDRQALSARLSDALEAGDEDAFQGAVNDFRTKWEAVRRDLEKAAKQAIGKACTVALAQFNLARPQLSAGAGQIRDLQSKCASDASDKCLKVNEFAGRFKTILTKFSDIESEMVIAEKMCQTPETADRQNLISLMRKIQADAEDLKLYGQALEAEKRKVIADTVEKACGDGLAKIRAAKTEIVKNDLSVLKGNVDRCKNRKTDECAMVNQLAGGFNDLNSKIGKFVADANKVESLCQGAKDESNLEQLGEFFGALQSQGDEINLAAKELRARQAEKASAAAFCRAATAKLEIAKQDMSAGMKEMTEIRSACQGKTDERCQTILALKDRFDGVRSRIEAALKKIADINESCRNAGTDPPSETLISGVASLAEDGEAVKKEMTELKSIKSSSYEMGREITIPAGSTWEGVLPAGKTLELYGRNNYARAAGGQFSLEIAVNGKPVPDILLNKGKTFKYADGRVFPYLGRGGGSASTQFAGGKPYTYYLPSTPTWMLFYAPDYAVNDTSTAGGYRVMTDPGQAARYVWDVSSLAAGSSTMTVRLRNTSSIARATIIAKMYVK